MYNPPIVMEFSNTIKYYEQLFQKSGMFDFYPEVKCQVRSYSDILSNSSISPRILQNFNYRGNYRTNIGSDQYDICWNIPSSIDGIRVNLGIDNPILYSDQSALDRTFLAKSDYSNATMQPIYVAKYLPIGGMVIIDGNHRLQLAKSAGQRTIPAIILDPSQHLDLMHTEQMRNLYKIHHNLVSLNGLLHSPIFKKWRFHSSHSLELDSFYHFGDKINFTFFKNIRLSRPVM